MSAISPTFNSNARYQELMVLLSFWIASSADADTLKKKAKQQELARRTVPGLAAAGPVLEMPAMNI